jgi:cytochrome c biogenesis protein CcmG/thiol:disulfide interchange protein DsbE
MKKRTLAESSATMPSNQECLHRAERNFESSPDAGRRALLRSSIGLGIAAAGGLLSFSASANELKIGQLAPPLVLNALDGRKIATRDLIGEVVIVTFWASYCEPCREELPLLSTYAARNAQHGLRVLGFSIDAQESLPDVRKVAASLSFPVGLLGSPWAAGYGRIWRMPVSFVIGRDGRLVYNGWDDAQPVWTKESLQRIIDPLLLPKS